jgi:hypothetical protein
LAGLASALEAEILIPLETILDSAAILEDSVALLMEMLVALEEEVDSEEVSY